MNSSRTRVVVSAIVLLGIFLFTMFWTPGGAVPLRKPLTELPMDIGAWTGTELYLTRDVLDVVGVDDYVMRIYRLDATATEFKGMSPVSLYVGYYESQTKGRTYHSPKNCMPGSGWEIVASDRVDILLAGKTERVNRVTIQKGLEKQLVMYWYQDRGRVISSEYHAKAYLVLDSMTRRRTDGALVRFVAPIAAQGAGADEETYRYMLSFVNTVYPGIMELFPE